MLNISLSIIGIVLILYAIFVIKSDMSQKDLVFKDLSSIEENVKGYYESTNDIISDFNELIDLKLEKIDDEKKQNEYKELDNNVKTLDVKASTYKNFNNNYPIIKHSKINNINKVADENHKKVIELLDIGLTKQEVAKKLNKGIREVEIIIKMYGK